MPALDVSDAFDPDFMDRLVRVRQAETVGDNGRATVETARIPFAGVVTNDNGDNLVRGSDAARVASTINVSAPGVTLRMDGPEWDADVVEWDARAYTVTTVKDYGRYGAGFCIATCTLIAPAG